MLSYLRSLVGGRKENPVKRRSWVRLCTVILIASVLGAASTLEHQEGAAYGLPFRGLTDASAQPGADLRPFVGAYALQALIDFDSLEGAQFDPASKTLALFGRRARPNGLLSVPYLDYLAAAMETSSPTFSLRWTAASRQEVQATQQNTDGLNILDDQRRVNAFGAWLFQTAGVKVAPGTNYDALGEKVMAVGGLQKIFAAKEPIAVPPEIVRLTFTVEPKMKPIVKGMPERSVLAQVALEADVQAKYLAAIPELRGKVPGYQTYSDWERTHGGVEGAQHTWIAPDKFEIKESSDGQIMRFGRTLVRFRIEKYVGVTLPEGSEQSTTDPTLSGYADMLTRNYDALAGEFPVFQQLREAFKVLAVFDWMKRHAWKMDLPKQGRIDMNPPTEVTGIVNMEVAARAPTDSRLVVHRTTWITGGIDLRVADNSFVVKLPDLGRLPIISPVAQDDEELRRILRRKSEVPLPEIPGWVAQAHSGQEALSYVALRGGQLSHCGDPAAALTQLDRVKRKASMLAYYDGQINAATREREASMTELAKLKTEAEDKQREYWNETYQAVVSLLVDLDALHTYSRPILLLPARESAERIEHLDQARRIGLDLKAALEKRASPTEYRIEVGERLAELASELKKQWDLTSPHTWLDAREMAAHRMVLISSGAHVISLTHRVLELQDALQTTDELNQKMGDAAQQTGRIQSQYQHYTDSYRDERNKLEAMMKNCK